MPSKGMVYTEDMRIGGRSAKYVREMGGDTDTQDGAHKLDCNMAAIAWNDAVEDLGDLPEEDFRDWREAVNHDLNFRAKSIRGNQVVDREAEKAFEDYIVNGECFNFNQACVRKLDQYVNVHNEWVDRDCVFPRGSGDQEHLRVPPAVFAKFAEIIDRLQAVGRKQGRY